jgi:hypothetical protein
MVASAVPYRHSDILEVRRHRVYKGAIAVKNQPLRVVFEYFIHGGLVRLHLCVRVRVNKLVI